jgi:predicted phosphodiesterase
VRVLLTSDLHANPAALAVLPPADAVLCAGDLVDYGPDPRAAIAWCRAHDAHVVFGNHDRALAFGEPDGVGPLMREASAATREAHRALVDDDDLAYLRALPQVATVRLGGATFALAHALAGDPRRYVPLPDAAASVWDAVPDADVVVVGHTHVQGTWVHDRRTAINPGSVGMATRGGFAQYALWVDGRLELRSTPYDLTATLAALERFDLPAEPRAVLESAFRRGREVVRR